MTHHRSRRFQIQTWLTIAQNCEFVFDHYSRLARLARNPFAPVLEENSQIQVCPFDDNPWSPTVSLAEIQDRLLRSMTDSSLRLLE